MNQTVTETMPVSLAEAKLQLNILSEADDSLIPIYISGVVRRHEKLEGRRLTDRLVEFELNPEERECNITEFPFRGVTLCAAYNSDDEPTELDYIVDLEKKTISITGSVPVDTALIKISYLAGLSEADKQEEKLALLASIAEAYQNRGDEEYSDKKSLGFTLAMRNRHGGI